uniref:Uncharacterized protein n=1 Tax=Amphiprion ocellaris TaxID=80972 RepID=A0A3Q1CTU1_AMPOC
MPGSDTSHLPQTLVSLPGQFLRVPAAPSPTFEAVTLADPDDVDHLVLVEDGRYGNSLLQMLLCPVHLIRDAASIQLHLHDVGFFLLYGQHCLATVGQHVWDLEALFLHLMKIFVQLLLSRLILPLLAVLAEGLLLALSPVFVKSALALVTEMLGKDGFQGTQTADGFNVSHNPHHDDRWSFDDGNRLNLFPLHTEASTVNLPQGVGHPGLVSQEGGEVDGVAGVVFGPRSDPPTVLLAALVGQKPHVPVARCVEFTMRLKKANITNILKPLRVDMTFRLHNNIISRGTLIIPLIMQHKNIPRQFALQMA